MAEVVHLAYSGPHRRDDTRCGTGDRRAVTADERLVTCELCRYWAHRGYTATGRVSLAQIAAREASLGKAQLARKAKAANAGDSSEPGPSRQG
jgi:hypothetical protein